MAGIDLTSLIINSGGICNQLEPLERQVVTENDNNVNQFIVETKIQSPNQSLQSK